MGTRANIIIADQHEHLLFYRHSDGYPEGVKETLETFMQWVKEGKIRDNAPQSAGWLIMIGAAEYNTREFKLSKTSVDEKISWTPDTDDDYSGWRIGSYEPTTCIHMDIAHLYILDLVTKQIVEIKKEFEFWEYHLKKHREKVERQNKKSK